MATTSVPVPADLAAELQESFWQGPIINDKGHRLLTEEEVDRITNKLVVKINADEHPPPHFHVTYSGQNASFSIADGSRLPGIVGLEKFDKNIHRWWKTNRCELISVWNRTRPTNCQVGTVPVPPECQTGGGNEAS